MRALRIPWVWGALGALLVALGSGLLWSAYERNAGDGFPPPSVGEGGTVQLGPSIFSSGEEFDPALWYAAGSAMILAAAASLAFAVRLRARAA
jgi:hypothetical protein